MLYRILRALLCLAFGLLAGFSLPYGLYLDHVVSERFEQARWTVPGRVYARPLVLVPGMPLDAAMLESELQAARYRKAGVASGPGSYRREGSRFSIHTRGFTFEDGHQPSQQLQLQLEGSRLISLRDGNGQVLRGAARLDPARIATLYSARQEDRIPINAAHAPLLLVTGLQAVEDRQFARHRGVDVQGIARAAWANIRAGRLSQGGSTLTQQLVRSLYLTRERTWLRKFNEAAMAMLMEWRYDKRAILEAYLNEVYLGQAGGQAIHGVGAAAEFYFGRGLDQLDVAEIALLIGLIRGPSFYDPRRAPERALARRERVLAQFAETGLIDDATRDRAAAQPLGVLGRVPPARNPYPAFLSLVREQLASDYRDRDLGAGGLNIMSTLAPSVQRHAEQSLSQGLEALGDASLQGALVVTDPASGEVLAVVGGRDPRAGGFNRALHASRPVGSLIKPFVYLMALSEPSRWHLGSILDDLPVTLTMDDGQRWSPENFDRQAHGPVLLIDALSQSYNLATVQLGLQLNPGGLSVLMRSLGVTQVPEFRPSHWLGAFEMAPLEVAQTFQFLASGGHALPLRAVRGVVDSEGETLRRYGVRPGRGSHRSASALVSVALQQAARTGTARALSNSPLAALNPAGKTGTSNERRDSWFAGWTGSHLAVVWVGHDDNRPTALTGASGALRIWQALFEQLPGLPLEPRTRTELGDAWVDPQRGWLHAQACAGARHVVVDPLTLAGEVRQCSGEPQQRRWFSR